MNLVGYPRVSSEGQKDRDTIDMQIFAMKEFCVKNSHVMPDSQIFREEAVSGKSDLEDRPALIRLLEYVESHPEVDGILVYKLDRLARDLVIQERLISDFNKLGKKLVSTMEPDLDSTDSTRVLVRHMLGAIAQYEKGVIAMRMAGGKLRKARKGGYNGGYIPYGYKNEDGVLVINEEEATVVRMIYGMKLGMNTRQIAKELNERGVNTSRGGKWDHSTVRNILTNKIYHGINKYKSVECSRPELKIINMEDYNLWK